MGLKVWDVLAWGGSPLFVAALSILEGSVFLGLRFEDIQNGNCRFEVHAKGHDYPTK